MDLWGSMPISILASTISDSDIYMYVCQGLSVWSLHVLPVSAWVFSPDTRASSYSPRTCRSVVRLMGDSKLTVKGCLSLWVGDLS